MTAIILHATFMLALVKKKYTLQKLAGITQYCKWVIQQH